MKSHVCQHSGCTKSFTRAEHLRRHALNHEQPRNGYTCERCSVHFQRADLLGTESDRKHNLALSNFYSVFSSAPYGKTH